MKSSGQRGFTLVELLMAIGIVGVLATLSLGGYLAFIVRSQIAQTLVNYDHIRTVVTVETRAGGARNLHLGSQAGQVPPALHGLLETREFNGPDGMTLQLVDAPPQTFGANTVNCYALVARASGEAGERRLRLLRQELPHAPTDKVWLSGGEFVFPLDMDSCHAGANRASGAGTTPVPSVQSPASAAGNVQTGVPPSAAGGWRAGAATDNGNGTWNAHGRVCIDGRDGKPLVGGTYHVQIKVTDQVRTWNGQAAERSFITQMPLDAAGCADFDRKGIVSAGAGKEGVVALAIDVVSVLYYWPANPAIPWDGTRFSTRIAAP